MDPIIGQVIMFAGNFPPKNWALCDGRLLQIKEFTPLFSIIGTTHGGDGQTTFGLPNLPANGGMNYIIATEGVFPSR